MDTQNLSESIEEYLEMLFTIEEDLGLIYNINDDEVYVSTSMISNKLDIAPASVTQMLKKLNDLGYVTYVPYKGALLTENGLIRAKKVSRKHRILERFLFDVLGIKHEKIHEQACDMEHVLSDDAERALCHMLNHPDKCPDGSLIPECDLNFNSCDECLEFKSIEAEEIGSRNNNLYPLSVIDSNVDLRISFIRGTSEIILKIIKKGLHLNSTINVMDNSKNSFKILVKKNNWDNEHFELVLEAELLDNIFVKIL